MNINFKGKDFLDIIYQARNEKIDKILKETNKRVNDKLYNIKYEEFIKKAEDKEKLKEIFCNLEDNYNIKITEYNKELYKLGFIDGIRLIVNIIKESDS